MRHLHHGEILIIWRHCPVGSATKEMRRLFTCQKERPISEIFDGEYRVA